MSPIEDTGSAILQRRLAGFGQRQIITLVVLFFIGDWLGAGAAIYFAVASKHGQVFQEDLFSGWVLWPIVLTVLVVLWYGRGVQIGRASCRERV